MGLIWDKIVIRKKEMSFRCLVLIVNRICYFNVCMHQLEVIENDVVIGCQMYIQYNNDFEKFYFFLFLWYINVSIFFFFFFIGQKISFSPFHTRSLPRSVGTVELRILDSHTLLTYSLLFFFFSPVQMDTQFQIE